MVGVVLGKDSDRWDRCRRMWNEKFKFAVRRQELEYRRCTGILVVRYVSKILTAVPVEAAVLGCSNI